MAALKGGRTMLRGFAGALDAANAEPLDPKRKVELEVRLKVARQIGDLIDAVAVRSQLLAGAESEEERADMLQGLAEDALAAAAGALTRAVKIRAGDAALLQRLRAVYEAAGLWREAVDAGVEYAESIGNRSERARALVSAADLARRDPEGRARAMALYDAAIEDVPQMPGAFESMERLMLEAGDHGGLDGVYARQIARLDEHGASEAALGLTDKLATLREEQLGDSTGAVAALDQLVTRRPADVAARDRLARLLSTLGRDDLAIRCLELGTLHVPTHPETYRAMHRILARTQDVDRAYEACSVLVQLGEATIDEQLFYQQHAPRTTTRAKRPLEPAAWAALMPEALDADVQELVLAAAPAAIGVRLEQMRAGKQLTSPDPRERQDPEKSTVSAVRSVAYASWLLGMPVPAIYARSEEVPGGIAVLSTPDSAVLLGQSVLVGRSVPELTFVAARTLATVRATSRLLGFYSTLPDLKLVFAAAFAAGGGGAASVSPDVLALSRAIAQRLDAASRKRLAAAVQRLAARGGQVDLIGWARSVEIGACRAGLLASGDITVAARMLSFDGRVIGGLSAADRLKALLPFSVSRAYADLRRSVGAQLLPSPNFAV